MASLLSVVSVSSWLTVIALSENNVTLIVVAAIAAGSSVLSAWWSRSARQETKRRRVVVTKTDEAVTVTDEDLEDLEDDTPQ